MAAGKLRGSCEQVGAGDPAVPDVVSNEGPELAVSRERGHLTAGGDGLMVQSGLACGLGSWDKDGATGRGGRSKGETGLPGSGCRAETQHQLGTRQPKARIRDLSGAERKAGGSQGRWRRDKRKGRRGGRAFQPLRSPIS